MKNLFKSILVTVGLLTLAPSVVYPVISVPDQARLVYQNLLDNPGFENGNTKWTASGGATKTANATAKGTGNYGYDWNSNGAAQTLTSTAVTIPAGMQGQNAYATCGFKTPSGTATHTINVYDGSNVLASATLITSSTRFAAQSLNFVMPTSGTIAIRITAVAADEPEIYIDDCYIGLANNISTSTNVTDWVDYTLTIGATTTPPTQGAGATKTARWRRVGGNMEVQFTYAQTAAGSSGSGVYLFPLPSGGYAMDTTKVTVSTAGNGAGGTVVGVGQAAFTTTGGGNYASDLDVIPYNTTNFQLIAQTGPFGPAQGNVSSSTYQLSSNPTYYSFSASVPIVGWSAEPAFRPDLAAVSWSGYHDNTCSWARTNTAYGAFTDDASCALVERTNRNFGTVSTNGSVSPAITFTPARIGRYYVCATARYTLATSTETGSAKLTDGTTTIAESRFSNSGGPATGAYNPPLCGIYNAASTSAVTLTVQGAATAGSITISSASPVNSSLEWSIFALDQGFPAPILLGSVTSKSTNAVGFESVTFGGATEGTNNCTSSPCTMYRNSAGISSVTRSATGIYVINFASGTFSAAPSCVANGIVMGTGLGSYSQSTVTAPTSTTFNLNSKNHSSIDADSGNVTVVCTGTK